jgi:cyclophilin family peptidyl-prolyl cis-trans isomerase
MINLNEMKRMAFALAIAAILASGCQGSENQNNTGEDTSLTTENKEMKMKQIEEPEFDIITSHGTMRVRLYNNTPLHRNNFVKHVSNKFYDGIRFHRVIEDFMIQTGDPYSRDTSLINKWGTGGPDPEYTVPAEFVKDYHHKKGALAAARKGNLANPKKASSGSQFYIVHDSLACSHLDGEYTIFGEVISGIEVIDAIATVPTDRYDRPCEDVIITTIKPIIKAVQSSAEPTETEPLPTDTTKTE